MTPPRAPSPHLLRFLRQSLLRPHPQRFALPTRLSACSRSLSSKKTTGTASKASSPPPPPPPGRAVVSSNRTSSSPVLIKPASSPPHDQQQQQHANSNNGQPNPPPPPPPPGQSSPRRRRGLLRTILYPLGTLLALYPLIDFINSSYIQIMPVTGPSMSPLLNADHASLSHADPSYVQPDRVLVDMRKKNGVPLRRGDVVAFWSPVHPERMVVKRILAMEGDVVTPRALTTMTATSRTGLARKKEEEGRTRVPRGGDKTSGIDISSSASKDTPHAVFTLHKHTNPPKLWTMDNSTLSPTHPIVIPQGQLWVEGDHPDGGRKSYDSNVYGPISQSLVVGKIVAVVWPWRRMAWIRAEDWVGAGERVKVAAGLSLVEMIQIYTS